MMYHDNLHSKMLEPLPFRFLDLPKELRFMVYEHLTISTKQYILTPLEDKSGFQVSVSPQKATGVSQIRPPALTITLHTLPVQVFSTCSLVYSEALPFLSRKLDVISETVPRVVVDPECLDTLQTQELFRKLLVRLDRHPFFTSQKFKLDTLCPNTQDDAPLISKSNLLFHQEQEDRDAQKDERSPGEIQLWLEQTTHLLLSQPPATPSPFAGFMGIRVYPTVRLVLDVRRCRPISAPRSVEFAQSSHGSPLQTQNQGEAESETTVSPSLPLPPVHTTTNPAVTRSLSRSVASRLSILYSGLVQYTRGLRYVRSGAIVLGQEESKIGREGKGEVWKRVALDFGIVRVSERGE